MITKLLVLTARCGCLDVYFRRAQVPCACVKLVGAIQRIFSACGGRDGRGFSPDGRQLASGSEPPQWFYSPESNTIVVGRPPCLKTFSWFCTVLSTQLESGVSPH